MIRRPILDLKMRLLLLGGERPDGVELLHGRNGLLLVQSLVVLVDPCHTQRPVHRVHLEAMSIYGRDLNLRTLN